jgi:hypothetical protein
MTPRAAKPGAKSGIGRGGMERGLRGSREVMPKQKCAYHEPTGLLPFFFAFACLAGIFRRHRPLCGLLFPERRWERPYTRSFLFATYGFLEIAKRLLSVESDASLSMSAGFKGIYDPGKEPVYARITSIITATRACFSPRCLEFRLGPFHGGMGLTCLVGFNNVWFFVPVVGIAAYPLCGGLPLFLEPAFQKKRP